MSELSETNAIAEDLMTDELETASSWSMLFTMILMTAGFIYSSALFVNESMQVRTEEGEPILVLSALIDHSKSLVKLPAMKGADGDHLQTANISPLTGIKNMVLSHTSSDTAKWPKLKITGFGKSADGTEKFAIINGDLVHPGEFAGKIQLIEVRIRDVVVEYNGERRTLTLPLED